MSKQLIITGMHRSGTSLVTNVIQETGVHIGENLLGSYKGNKHGHFEDFDFLYLHENILRRFGETPFTQTRLTPNQIMTTERDMALHLIKQREAYQLWGWKDPRTALFLDFWHDLLPDATYIFVYRHPFEVISSLVRRGTDIEILAAPHIGLQAWQTYNQAILDFYQQHPENSILCNIHSLISNIPSFVNLIAKKFELSLKAGRSQKLFDPHEFHRFSLAYTPQVMELLELISPNVATLYNELEKHANIPHLTLKQDDLTPVSNRDTLDKIAHLRTRIMLQEINAHLIIFELLALLDPEAVLGIPSRAKELSQEYSRIKTDYMVLLVQTSHPPTG